ncbi:MAG TPA: glycosyltransferase [Patescibacteria group bacterium]|nr:glycosyltransferase [Patescibacteria group bacterium]
MINVWDKNWQKGIAPDIHPELIHSVEKYAKGKKILEVGFGSGGDLTVLTQKGFDCTGIETSKVAYQNAKKKKQFKSFFQNGEETTFGDSTFDAIFHQGVLEHFKNPQKFIREQRRILKNKGMVVVDVPQKWNLFTIYKNILQFLGIWYGGWERSYSVKELTTLLKSQAFTILKVEYRGIYPHRWGKLIYPEKIIKRKWAKNLLSNPPFNIIQKTVRKLYDSSSIIRLLSAHNLIVVAEKRPASVGIDARYAEGDLVGIGKFIRDLTLNLSKKGITCTLFYSQKPKYPLSGRNIKSVILPAKNRYLFEQVALPKALASHKIDYYHAAGNIGVPLFCPVPALLTVHDIIPLEIKDYFSYSPFPFLSKASYLFRLKTSLLKAQTIVTDSLYVKKQIASVLGVPPGKVTTIYPGAPRVLKEGNLPASLKNQKYILNHGGIDIRKNQEKLIEAFLPVSIKFPEIKLVITGENIRMRKNLDKLAAKLGLTKRIIFTGYLTDATLAAVIRNAALICYPSLSEGFGFPVLEGFASKVPVISSHSSSIPEIAGDAAILVDPTNVPQISKAIDKVLTDKKLRGQMAQKGIKQYNKFDWEKAANEYIRLYNNL